MKKIDKMIRDTKKIKTLGTVPHTVETGYSSLTGQYRFIDYTTEERMLFDTESELNEYRAGYPHQFIEFKLGNSEYGIFDIGN